MNGSQTLLFGPTPHDEAIRFIADKPLVSREVFNGLLPELKALALCVTGIEDMTVLASVQSQLASLPAGVPWDKAKRGLIKSLHPYLDDAESGDKRSTARAELLLRTHGFQAYQAASYRVMKRQEDVFPYWQYKSMEDARVRPAHAALDHIVLPANHEFWNTHFPPWQWNCRCQCIPLSQDDYDEIKAADETRADDHRWILDDAAQQELTNTRRLVRNGVTYNVSSDAEKGKEGAYVWHPSTLRVDLAALRKRYDPQTFAKFEAWAQVTEISPGLTVWQWLLNQGPTPTPAVPAIAKAPRKPRAKKAAPEIAAAPLWPASVDGLQKVKSLGGSTGAELVRDPATGRLFVLKRGNSPEHVREEYASDMAYRALGASVPEARLYETAAGPVKVAEHIEGEQLGTWLKKASAREASATLARLQQHFSADALLGNWDVAGMGLDNILVDKAGVPWRIDNGGSLRFRAQGAKKTDDEWNNFATELWTMRDPATNPQTAKLFAGTDIFAIGKQIAAIDAAAEKRLLGELPAELHDVVSARLANLREIGRKALEMESDQWKATYTDELTREMMGLRKAGLIADLPAQLIGQPGEVHLVDAQGNAFDHLRAQRSKPVAAPKNDGFYETIVNAAKTINAHHASGNTSYNQGKLQAAENQRATLLVLKKTGSAEHKALANYYLGVLDELKAAQGDTAKKVALVTPPGAKDKNAGTAAAAAKTAAPAASLVERLAQHMKAHGGDWSHVAGWASAQAGSSRSQAAAAYKYFLFQQLEGAKADEFYLQPDPAAFKKTVPASQEDGYRRSMLIHHAFVQETLAHVAFPTNDLGRRRVRILRTETAKSAVPFKVGTSGQYRRGVNESGSLFRPVFSGARTITNVPHSRVTSLYFLERTPGSGGSFLLGDGENEATYIGWKLEAHHASDSYFNTTAGTDSTKWEI